MKKLVSKFLAALSTIIGYAFLMAHCVYADIALPPEPSKEDSAIVVIVNAIKTKDIKGQIDKDVDEIDR